MHRQVHASFSRSGLATAFLCLALAWPAVAVPPPADGIGVLWGLDDLQILIVGEMASGPGLECIATDPIGDLGMYSLVTGQKLETVPDPFNNKNTQFVLRDIDGDGLAELVAFTVTPTVNYILGVLDLGTRFEVLWQQSGFGTDFSALEFMNLNAAQPLAMTFLASGLLQIIDPMNGTLLYDSSEDLDLGQGTTIVSYLTDDFDLDGYDELLVEVREELFTIHVLIGDRSPTSGALDTPGVGRTMLRQNYPNPFNSGTTIQYELTQPGKVRLRIFDTMGRLVRTMVDENAQAGVFERPWNGKDDGGQKVASGIYFYELDVDGRRETRKLVQVK